MQKAETAKCEFLRRCRAERGKKDNQPRALPGYQGQSPWNVCNILEIPGTNQRVLLHRGRSKILAALEQCAAKGPAMLTCREVTQIVTDYLEGRQSLRERLRFQVHLGICLHCRAYLKQMKTAIAAIGRLSGESIPPR